MGKGDFRKVLIYEQIVDGPFLSHLDIDVPLEHGLPTTMTFSLTSLKHFKTT